MDYFNNNRRRDAAEVVVILFVVFGGYKGNLARAPSVDRALCLPRWMDGWAYQRRTTMILSRHRDREPSPPSLDPVQHSGRPLPPPLSLLPL